MMRIYITGADGYVGWPLAQELTSAGHTVYGVDANIRRRLVSDTGGNSIIPILTPPERVQATGISLEYLNIAHSPHTLRASLGGFQPDCIMHLAAQPSAPYSMRSVTEAWETIENNNKATVNILWAMRESCPETHLIQIGTMGEYGTPGVLIPEGCFPYRSFWKHPACPGPEKYDPECDAPHDISGMQFPRKPGSFYHLSKVNDTHAIEMACRLWGLRSTDIMQGVVYGTRWGEAGNAGQGQATRFDIDESFGTVINRWVAQAILGIPLTLYGAGHQKRGFVSLRDCVASLQTVAETCALRPGSYRTLNQIDEVYDLTELSEAVCAVATDFDLAPTVDRVENPREEAEEHEYTVHSGGLRELGFTPTGSLSETLREMFEDLRPHRERIRALKKVLAPKTKW